MDILSKNISFKNLHKGKRAFVIGNGPSLNKQYLPPLKDEVTIVSNSFYRHPLFDLLSPSYYILADPSMWEENPGNHVLELTRERFEGMGLIKDNLNVFLPIDAYNFINSSEIYRSFNSFYFQYDPNFQITDEIDFTNPVPLLGQTVTLVGIMLALYLGCNPIYLMGCDMNWTPQSVTIGKIEHFYEEESKAEKSIINDRINNKNNIYSDENFIRLCTEKMYEQYEIIKKYSEIHGKQIYNSTVGGNLNTFERVRFSSLWKEKIESMAKKAIIEYNKSNYNKVLEIIDEIEKFKEFPKNINLLKSFSFLKLGKASEAKKYCLRELECYESNITATQFIKEINKDFV